MTRRSTVLTSVVVAVVLSMASDAAAKLSAPYVEWRSGPAQWLMTSEEQRAWKGLAADDEASRFIDLFWAKRDPSPGTVVNEFRDEYESRVVHADRAYAEKGKRGAMTDRGRVYIVLGSASNASDRLATRSTQTGGTGNDPTGDRTMGARFSWTWDFDDAQKFDMPKIEVVFIQDPVTQRVQRDPQRGDFGRANHVAIQKAITSPDLKEVPSWALQGGLNPSVAMIQEAPRRPVSVGSAPVEEVQPDPAIVPVASTEPGARLLLLRDAGVVAPNSATDPFAGIASIDAFTRKDSIGWVVQYCAEHAEVPVLKYLLHVAGPFDGDSSDRVTPEKQVKGTPLKALPGCYLLRGAMPLSKLTPGTYELGILLDEPKTGASYHPKQEFKVTN